MSRSRKTGSGETVQAVTRALSLLEIMAQTRRSLTVSELARESGLKLATVHRLLYTMMQLGFVEQATETLRYRLGIKAFEIGNAATAALDLRTVAHPWLQRLSEQLNETANLAVLDGTEVVYVDQVESTNLVIVKMFARIGNRGPAYCTATGKLLLATLTPAQLEQWLGQVKLIKFTPQTITDRQQLLMVLEQIRRDDYAIDRSERDEGVICVAAPVRNNEGQIQAALSISGPLYRMTPERIEQVILPAVIAAATEVSKALGYRAAAD